MNDAIRDIVIVGGGLAGAKAAEAVRDEGFAGRLTIVAEEAERPYERPPLSKGFLVGEKTADDTYVHGPEFYDEHDIDLSLDDAAVEIDRTAGQVVTAGGRRLPFDRLLLATGAAPRRLHLAEEDLDGIVVLRTLDDSRALGERLRAVNHVTIVGAGWIGCEVASAARTFGTDVTLVDPLDAPLIRVLGAEVGQVFADLHAEHGVDLRMGMGVDGADGKGAVERVKLSDGTTIETELVVVGVGVIPRTDLAIKAGLDVDDGIVVDQQLVSSDPRILAAGDVASAWHPVIGQHIRVEHWANALNQGTAAGRNLVGADQSYERIPYFFSDQYDLGMEYSGHAGSWDQVVFRGSREQREFLAFWLDQGRVVAGMNVNVWDVIDDIKALIGATDIAPARLADPSVPLTDLVAG